MNRRWTEFRSSQLSRLSQSNPSHRRCFSSSGSLAVKQVPTLDSWSTGRLQDEAWTAGKPVKLPQSKEYVPPACSRWFIQKTKTDSSGTSPPPSRTPASELRTAFWSEHEQVVVPLELTRNTAAGNGHVEDANSSTFLRTEAPLKVLLAHLCSPAPTSPSSVSSSTPSPPDTTQASIYLAQCELADLPASIRDDVPIPELVRSVGKGDVYSSSLWMGRPPTYTPLHRDPNPNFFFQLAGQKVVRLFPPDVGGVIFEHVQDRLFPASRVSGGHSRVRGNAAFRGEEMMQGAEKEMLHDLVWEKVAGTESDNGEILSYAQDVHLRPGEALFIPKGWWHSVKGVGEGVTASVNWWFR